MTDQICCEWCSQPIRSYPGDWQGEFKGRAMHINSGVFGCDRRATKDGMTHAAKWPEVKETSEDKAAAAELRDLLAAQMGHMMQQVGRHGSASAVLTQAAEYEAEIARKRMDRTILNPAPNAAAQRIIAEADAPHDPPSNILRGLKYGLIGSGMFWAFISALAFIVWWLCDGRFK